MMVRKTLARVAAAVALLGCLSACGSTVTIGGSSGGASGSNAGIELISGSQPAPSTPDASTVSLGSLSAPSSAQLTARQSALGTIVVDSGGRTLYRFDKDSPSPSTTNCTGGCETTWPPVLVQPQGKVYANGVATTAVGTVRRPDGGLQLTIGGWPVYRFSGDHAAGDTSGQGVNGTWFAIAPDGTKAAATTTAPSAGSATGPGVLLTARRTSHGLVVVDAADHTVYVNSTDRSSPSTVLCTARCSTGFVPVPAGTGTVGITGVTSSEVGSVRRPDGTEQLTLVGFPLYTNVSDHAPGDVHGTSVAGWFTVSLDSAQQ